MKKRRHQSQPPAASPTQAASSPAASAARALATAAGPPDVVKETGSEPVVRRAAVPAIIFGVLAAFVFWGDMHIQGQGGELDARVHYPFNSVKEIDALHIKSAEDPRITRGRDVYSLACKTCHQEDGSGGVAQGCPPLAGSEWVNVNDPARMIRILLNGLTGPIMVKGKAYGTGSMLPFRDSFGDDDLAAVLSFVRSRKEWGNNNPLVRPEDVKAIRDATKDKPGYYTADELLQVPLKP